MDRYEKIEMRKIVPVAAMISAGKSKLLNVLYNINFLECKAGIGTKFVNILRYNPNIKEPRFFHLRIKKQGEEYIFYKDKILEDIIGEKNIIEENKKINDDLSHEFNFDYENIFYMTEINESPFIKDEEYLLTHDLCDIPGLSEYQGGANQTRKTEETEKEKKEEIIEEKKENQSDKENRLEEAKQIFLNNDDEERKEENDEEKEKNFKHYLEVFEKEEEEENNNDKKEEEEDDIVKNIKIEENTYLSEIFKIIKNYIDGAIIVLSIENYYFTTNFEIIAGLYRVIKKTINNFLIILNKADLSTNLTDDVNKCKGLFMKYFPNCKPFNINLNTFIPLSTIQVQNELLLDKSFKHLLKYHFYNYMKKFKNSKSKNIKFNISFIDNLREIIIKIEKGITCEKIEKKVNEFNNPGIDDEIISIIKELKNDFKGQNINFGIIEDDFKENENDEDIGSDMDEEYSNDEKSKSIDKVNPSYILKFLYIYHTEKKLIPSPSEETINLINYFKVRKELINTENNKKDDKITEKTKLNKRIIRSLKSIAKEIKDSNFISDKINNIILDIYQTVRFLKIYDVIFIPFLGPSNAGKSTIINGIVGEEILPTALKESTKRGIVIRYLDDSETEINIRKAVFKEKEFFGKKKYYFERRKEVIAKGLKGVQDTVKGLNYFFADKEEDSFYYIRTKIKLFDDIGLDNEFKKMIYLIDFPGHGTDNFFERNKIYNKIISISNLFVFVVKNSVIKETKNKEILEDIFSRAKKEQSKFSSGFIKNCLFILNNDNNQETKKKDLDEAKNDISELIKINQKDISTLFFNANFYVKYINNYNYFFNIKNTFTEEFKNYFLYKSNIFLYPENYNKKLFNNICNFILNNIKEKLDEAQFVEINWKNEEIKENVKNELNKVIEEFEINKDIEKNEFSDKNKDAIGKIFSFVQKNINELPTLKGSNIEEFQKIFLNQINDVNIKLQEELKIKLNQIIITLDCFFHQDFSIRKKDLKVFNEFIKSIEEIQSKMLLISQNSKKKIEIVITNYEKNVIESLEDEKQNVMKLLRSKISKDIKKEIEKKMLEFVKIFNDEINNLLKSITDDSSELYKKGKKLFADFTDNEILLDEIIDFKNYFTEKVSNKDGNIYEELEKEIKDCFNKPMHNIYKEKGLLSYLSSLIFEDNYLKHILKLLIKCYTQNIKYIFNLINNTFKDYIEGLNSLIETRKNIIIIRYTENQTHQWNNLCQLYSGKKDNISKDLLSLCKK